MLEKNISNAQRKAIDQAMPTARKFAEVCKGTIRSEGAEITLRVFAAGLVTVQLIARGKNDDCKLEVTGVRRSGIETKRTVFSLNAPDYAVDETELLEALDSALRD